jgi:DNA-binding response OmpR family regulator
LGWRGAPERPPPAASRRSTRWLGQPASLIISDLRLADGEGLDIVRAARAGPHPLPVIVVTGYASEERRRAALAAGAAAFFAKPFRASALLASVRTHLGGSIPED